MVSSDMRSEARRLRIVELKVELQSVNREKKEMRREVQRLNSKIASLEANSPPPSSQASATKAPSDVERALSKISKGKNAKKLLLLLHPDKNVGKDQRSASLLFDFVQTHR